jgi:(p)ppGpp synthase/HD superfamily hydrolase
MEGEKWAEINEIENGQTVENIRNKDLWLQKDQWNWQTSSKTNNAKRQITSYLHWNKTGTLLHPYI